MVDLKINVERGESDRHFGTSRWEVVLYSGDNKIFIEEHDFELDAIKAADEKRRLLRLMKKYDITWRYRNGSTSDVVVEFASLQDALQHANAINDPEIVGILVGEIMTKQPSVDVGIKWSDVDPGADGGKYRG